MNEDFYAEKRACGTSPSHLAGAPQQPKRLFPSLRIPRHHRAVHARLPVGEETDKHWSE